MDAGLAAYNKEKNTNYNIVGYIDNVVVKDDIARWSLAYYNGEGSATDKYFNERTSCINKGRSWNEEEHRCEQNTNAGTNTKAPEAHVTGCSSDYGLFSGLIKTGSDIFKGLRDLIYVVAGFGIIGVAVGGFFGNLN